MGIRYVMVGNSAAAIGAVEAIRQCDTTQPITIISDEPHHTYSRPLISYWLGGLVDAGRMAYRPADFYTRYKVQSMLGVQVTGIHTSEHTLSLHGGGQVEYDRLLIASGGKPFVPPTPGADLEGTFTLTRWDDAQRIDRYIRERGAKSVVVVGGGLIGLKTVEALLARGLRVTLIELADRILSLVFDRTASRLAETILRREHVDVRTGSTVQEIVGRGGRVDHALLRDGERLDCDMVIWAIGVRPNTTLIPQDSEIKINRGICVDLSMRTTAADVWAAGDCVEAFDMLLETCRPIAIWPNAYKQGQVAGYNMAGTTKAYEGGVAMNAMSICDVPTISVGITDPPANDGAFQVLEEYQRENGKYKKLVLKGNRLVGGVFFGEVDRAGIYTGLILDRVDVTPFKNHLLSGNFGLISLPKDYRKHLVTGEGIEV